jgi:hypothetical protein
MAQLTARLYRNALRRVNCVRGTEVCMRALVLISSLVSVLAQAADVRLGLPTVSGRNCSRETVSFAVAPDSSALTILFSNTSIQVPATAASNEAYGNCSMTVPLEVAPGKRLKLTRWDYRGFYSVGPKSGAKLIVTNRYLGQGEDFSRLPPHLRLARTQRTWFTQDTTDSARAENFQHSAQVPASGLPNTCGKDLLLNIDFDLRLFRGDSSQDAFLTLDSADGALGLTYGLETEDCRGGDTSDPTTGDLFSCSVVRGPMNRVQPGRCDTGAPIRSLEVVQSNGKCVGRQQGPRLPGLPVRNGQFFKAEGNFIVVTGECSGTFKVVR